MYTVILVPNVYTKSMWSMCFPRYGFDGKMKVDSPWRKMSFAAKQQGSAEEFSASTNLSWDEGKGISSTLEFSQM